MLSNIRHFLGYDSTEAAESTPVSERPSEAKEKITVIHHFTIESDPVDGNVEIHEMDEGFQIHKHLAPNYNDDICSGLLFVSHNRTLTDEERKQIANDIALLKDRLESPTKMVISALKMNVSLAAVLKNQVKESVKRKKSSNSMDQTTAGESPVGDTLWNESPEQDAIAIAEAMQISKQNLSMDENANVTPIKPAMNRLSQMNVRSNKASQMRCETKKKPEKSTNFIPNKQSTLGGLAKSKFAVKK